MLTNVRRRSNKGVAFHCRARGGKGKEGQEGTGTTEAPNTSGPRQAPQQLNRLFAGLSKAWEIWMVHVVEDDFACVKLYGNQRSTHHRVL